MNRIMGNPTATPMKVPDWNQNDPKKADFIKNKPLKEIASIESLHYYGDRDIVPNVAVSLRTVFDDEGWVLGDVVDIITLDNYSPYEGVIVLPRQCGGMFVFEKGKFLKADGGAADPSKVTKIIAPRLDNYEATEINSVYKDTFVNWFPNLETLVKCDSATKQYVDEKLGDVDSALEAIISIQNSLIGGDA